MIRGNVREQPHGARLHARRSLSVVLAAALRAFGTANVAFDIPPISLAYLAASLTKAGHRVRIIDAFGEIQWWPCRTEGQHVRKP